MSEDPIINFLDGISYRLAKDVAKDLGDVPLVVKSSNGKARSTCFWFDERSISKAFDGRDALELEWQITRIYYSVTATSPPEVFVYFFARSGSRYYMQRMSE